MQIAHSSVTAWSGIRKTLFRFFFLFFSLYVLLNPNGFIPNLDYVTSYVLRPFYYNVIPWIIKHVLHINYDLNAAGGGSGDTTFDYVLVVIIFIVSFLGCIIWTVIDRKRPDYKTLSYWLTVLVRYYVSFTMFTYGYSKFFKTQFPFPNPYGLMDTYGASSPMRLAWTFLGYSTGYNIFMGFAEVGAAILLLFRRTIRVGAILALVVTANIMAINYCFDVCVKLLSTTLVIMSIYLLLQGWEHHLNYFILNREVKPDSLTKPRFRRRWVNISLAVFKYLLIGYVLFEGFFYHVDVYKARGIGAPKPPLYGVYNVQTFIRNKDTLLPLTTDTTRWRRLIISNNSRAAVILMNDSVNFFTNKPDTVKHRVVLTYNKDTANKSNFVYSFIGKDGLELKGKYAGDSITVTFKKFSLDSLLLVNRGFHFINETPFNK